MPANIKIALIIACYSMALSTACIPVGTPATVPIGGSGSATEPVCPDYGASIERGILKVTHITEASGLAESRTNPNALWVHNDKGAGPDFYAISTVNASLLASYVLSDTSAVDWEDVSIGPGPTAGQSYLYFGDIGDNNDGREKITIFRVAEPNIATTGQGATKVHLENYEAFDFSYPEGPQNAETMFVDPRSGDLFIVTKSIDGLSNVYVASAPLSSDGVTPLTKIHSIQIGEGDFVSGESPLVTGGDITANGSLIAIRTYDAAYAWLRFSGDSVLDALKESPCNITLTEEEKGESLAFVENGSGMFTISEGFSKPLLFYQ